MSYANCFAQVVTKINDLQWTFCVSFDRQEGVLTRWVGLVLSSKWCGSAGLLNLRYWLDLGHHLWVAAVQEQQRTCHPETFRSTAVPFDVCEACPVPQAARVLHGRLP